MCYLTTWFTVNFIRAIDCLCRCLYDANTTANESRYLQIALQTCSINCNRLENCVCVPVGANRHGHFPLQRAQVLFLAADAQQTTGHELRSCMQSICTLKLRTTVAQNLAVVEKISAIKELLYLYTVSTYHGFL